MISIAPRRVSMSTRLGIIGKQRNNCWISFLPADRLMDVDFVVFGRRAFGNDIWHYGLLDLVDPMHS